MALATAAQPNVKILISMFASAKYVLLVASIGQVAMDSDLSAHRSFLFVSFLECSWPSTNHEIDLLAESADRSVLLQNFIITHCHAHTHIRTYGDIPRNGKIEKNPISYHAYIFLFAFFCITGWSHHLVSNRRYHFIIPAPEIGDRPLGAFAGAASGKVCPNCHDPVASSAYTCSTCNVDAVQGSILDLQSHLLHGVLHCNGFGHLLCVNGREKGSRLASGREIVDLWDRICAMLRAR